MVLFSDETRQCPIIPSPIIHSINELRLKTPSIFGIAMIMININLPFLSIWCGGKKDANGSLLREIRR